MAKPVDVFLSYAPEDEYLRGELERHLAGLQRDGVLRTWNGRRIAAGDDWRKTVEAYLSRADVVLLLVSANYLASDYLYEVEMMTALARARAGDARVIPVLLHACDWTISAFKGLTPLPLDLVPVSSWTNRNEAWAVVVRGIREAIAGPAAPVVAPVPAYDSAEIRGLAEEIERARLRKAALAANGASTEAVDGEILAMRRRMREGGQIRAGDALGDGRYLLLHLLGRGGFGAVWAAFDQTNGEKVAIKVLHPSQAQEASRRERFFRGARLMGSLQHEGVVRVLEPHGEDGGYLYFVMELVAGNNLHHAVIEKHLRPDHIVALILRVGEALGEAHARGIVHRDVKPANVVLDASGMPKLTDFDLVAAKDTTGGTRTGAMGTFLYAAPEQLINAKEADARADVYGLGMTAVFCLHAKELPALMPYKRTEVIAALECSESVKEVLTRAIALEPEERYADARLFCRALREAAVPAASEPAETRRAEWVGRYVVATPALAPVVTTGPVLAVAAASTQPSSPSARLSVGESIPVRHAPPRPAIVPNLWVLVGVGVAFGFLGVAITLWLMLRGPDASDMTTYQIPTTDPTIMSRPPQHSPETSIGPSLGPASPPGKPPGRPHR